MDAITLDQFNVLTTIVEEGSFAAAARRLGRAQSAVTYAVQKLEDQCGFPLFDRSAYRPVLTEEGHALLPRIRRIIDDVGDFRLQARSMSTGVEAELKIIMDSFLPLTMITPSLKDFHAAYPQIQLRIDAEWLKGAIPDLIEGHADFGIFIDSMVLPPELDRIVIDEIDLVAVAAPNHPLAQYNKRVSRDEMRDHLQIVVGNPKSSRSERSYGTVGINQWFVSNNQLRYSLITSGVGWGSLPAPMAAKDLENGQLVDLNPLQWDASNKMPRIRVILVKRKDKAFGPAAIWMMKKLSTAAID